MPPYNKQKTRFIILGAGEVGKYLAISLHQHNYQIILIDEDLNFIQNESILADIPKLTYDGLNPALYEELKLSENDVFVAVSNSDSTNLIACFLAKQYGSKTNIARINRPYLKSTVIKKKRKKKKSNSKLFSKKSTTPILTSKHWKALGLSHLFNVIELTSKEVIHLITNPGVQEIIHIPNTDLHIVSYRVKKTSLLCNRSLMAVNSVPVFKNFSIVSVSPKPTENILNSTIDLAIRKQTSRKKDLFLNDANEHSFIPNREYCIQEDDLLHICGAQQDFLKIAHLFDPSIKSKFKSIFVLGENHQAFEITLQLQQRFPKHLIYYIVPTKKEGFRTKKSLPSKVKVIVGSAHDIEIFQNEGLDQNCIFIAASESEDENVLACSLIKKHTAARTIAIINKTTNKHLATPLGIDSVISPKLLLSDCVLQALKQEMFFLLSTKGTDIEIISFIISNLNICNRPIQSLTIPHTAKIIVILRNKTNIFPRGEDKLKKNDTIIIFTRKESIEKLQALFINPTTLSSSIERK